jgi:hypothetical protein
LEAEIGRASAFLLALPESDEGAGPYSVDTVSRAADFLREHFRYLSRTCGILVKPPRILPGPAGSIDIHWQNDRYDLLMNIPSEFDKPATFYGEDASGAAVVKGSFKTDALNTGLLTWLLVK